MTLVVLVILAAVWAAVLLPPYLRNRSQHSGDSISTFRNHLSVLERATPAGRSVTPLAPRTVARPVAPLGAPGLPAGRSEARRRRRDILFTLGGATGLTFLLAIALGGVAYLFFLLAAGLLGGYCYLLVQMRKAEAGRAKVVDLRPGIAAEPEVPQRVVGTA